MNNKTKVAAYCRVSTNMEDQLNSLSAQIKYFTEYISEHEDWELVEVYYDEGITGTSVKKRDGFNRMIADSEDGRIDLILTKEVSRFARNTVDTLNYTRKLSALNIGVIFMNDGIDTREKDGELRLTIMSSIAQEESRKISERVKWGMRRKMENGYVYGYSHLLGYRIKEGKIEVIPEEAEIVRHIFHKYVYEGKGSSIIANELNAEGYTSIKGAIFRQDSVIRILKNEKYCGDLVQWKKVCTDYLTKKKAWNDGTNPNVPLVSIQDHHEPIISREVFEAAQELLNKRGKKSREGRKYSQHYWHSSRVYCGKCGSPFGITGRKTIKNRCLRCINRSKYGTVQKMNVNGVMVGCDNRFITEKVINTCMKYVLEHIQNKRDSISEQLLADIKFIQETATVTDTKPLQERIEKISEKKRNSVDLMLEGIISKDDLKVQVNRYDAEIAELSEQIANNSDISRYHQKQLEAIRGYIAQINQTENMDTDSFEVYNSMLKKIVVYDNSMIDFYLSCIPFGFHLTYRNERIPHTHNIWGVTVEKCEIISE